MSAFIALIIFLVVVAALIAFVARAIVGVCVIILILSTIGYSSHSKAATINTFVTTSKPCYVYNSIPCLTEEQLLGFSASSVSDLITDVKDNKKFKRVYGGLNIITINKLADTQSNANNTELAIMFYELGISKGSSKSMLSLSELIVRTNYFGKDTIYYVYALLTITRESGVANVSHEANVKRYKMMESLQNKGATKAEIAEIIEISSKYIEYFLKKGYSLGPDKTQKSF